MDHTFDPAFLGGTLRDINVYNIHYTAALFGAPKDARYFPNTGFNSVDTSGTLVQEYDGFSAVCTGAKDSDSPGFVCVQGEKGYMRIDGKQNVAPDLTTVIVDEDNPKRVRDAAGAMVRATMTETFVPEEPHHRMTKVFLDFAWIIDEKDTDTATGLLQETRDVMCVIEPLQKPAQTAPKCTLAEIVLKSPATGSAGGLNFAPPGRFCGSA